MRIEFEMALHTMRRLCISIWIRFNAMNSHSMKSLFYYILLSELIIIVCIVRLSYIWIHLYRNSWSIWLLVGSQVHMLRRHVRTLSANSDPIRIKSNGQIFKSHVHIVCKTLNYSILCLTAEFDRREQTIWFSRLTTKISHFILQWQTE